MDEIKLEMNEDGTAVLSAESVKALEQFFADAEQAAILLDEQEEDDGDLDELVEALDELEQALAELDVEEVEELEAPTENEIVLEERIRELERENLKRGVDLAIAKASQPVDGRIHSAAVLNAVKSLMLGETVGEEIQLEDATNPASIGKYMRQGVEHLLEIIPRQAKADGETVADDTRNLENVPNTFEAGKSVGNSFWGN